MTQDASVRADSPAKSPPKNAAPPWPPVILAIATVFFTAGFSAVWGGVMASLNRRRLDPSRFAWGPLLVGVAALAASLITSIAYGAPWWMSPYSRFMWLFRLGLWDAWVWWIGPAIEAVSCIFIVLIFVVPQRQRFQAWRVEGGRRSSVAVPLLAGMALSVGSLLLDVNSQTRFFASIADAAYREGLEELADGRPAVALEKFNEALRLNPDYVDALLQRGRLLARQGKEKDALADYARAVELRPADLDLRLERAELALAMGEIKQTIEDADKIIKAHPKLGLARYIRAVAYEHVNRFQEALADLDAAVEAEPKSALFRFERGRVRLQLGRIDPAIEDFTEAIEKAPNDYVYHTHRAMAYLQKQDLAKAVDDFSKAVKLAPTRLDLYWARANTYLEMEQPEKARADGLTALELIEPKKSEPGGAAAMARTLGLLARCSVRLNEIEKALDEANRAIKLDPKWAGGWLARGLAELASNKPAEAEKDFTKAIEQAAPTNKGIRARALYYRGRARKEQGETAKGDADQAEAKKLFPQITRAPALPNESSNAPPKNGDSR